ncbi:MAG TPA: DUF1320 domain-containing protein [Methylophilaceae bacterium]|nr:DUF1320 domain-containing protein [Methylophilaceae bacterium]
MTYASQQNMIDRFGEREVIALTDRNNDGAIDVAALTRGLEAADSEINTYLLDRYSLPLASTPLVLADKACDITRYLLCGAETVATEDIRDRYKDAIKFLEKVQMGKASLGLNAAQAITQPNDQILTSTRPRVFDSCTLKDY